VLVAAFGASRDMSAKGRSPAILNRGHHFQLWQIQMACVFPAIGSTMRAEDIRDLQFGTGHLRST